MQSDIFDRLSRLREIMEVRRETIRELLERTQAIRTESEGLIRSSRRYSRRGRCASPRDRNRNAPICHRELHRPCRTGIEYVKQLTISGISLTIRSDLSIKEGR
jgi:hypothetical protein